MSSARKRKSLDGPEKDAAKDMQVFEAMTPGQQALARLQEDTEKTSGREATRVREKVKGVES